MSSTDDFTTDQERFWAGEFGDTYVDRNTGPELLASKTARFCKVIDRTGRLASVLELGANVGLNLRAIRHLQPAAELTGVEINARAAAALATVPGCTVHQSSLLEWDTAARFELVFTSGVLIHIDPDALPVVYDLMARTSSKYVLMAEYYNPQPVEVPYRGHSGRLFKRDFAGEFLDGHPEFELVDCGFDYHRAAFPADDTTWFLMRRTPRP